MCAVINFYLNVFSGPKNSATLLQWSGSSKLLDQEVQMTSQKKMSREKNYKLQYCEERKFSFFTQHQRISNTAKINVSEINIRMLFIYEGSEEEAWEVPWQLTDIHQTYPRVI